MVCTETILGKIVEKIVDTVFQSAGRHVGFMLHYKQNLKNLDDVENNLQKQRSSVQGKVDEANHRGEAINYNVLAWLKDADETRQGVDNFRDEKTVKENMLCFNFSCPNFISRYRLSKEAKDKVVHVKHVTEEGGKIENVTVSHPREAPPKLEFPSSKDYEGFDSRDKVFKDIVKALKDPEVNRIGVYGTRGVGKTTMVTKVGELVKKDGTFYEVVMAVVSQDANVIRIQAQLAICLNLILDGETEVGRAKQLWNRLDNGKKNLIILDDVWQELDLKEIGIPITDGNKSCKVVLTSRKRDVWKYMDVKDFRIEILSEGESWALFKKKVGNYVDAHHELRKIARAVCKECQGLPVAIIAIGAALKHKDMYAWKDALYKLKNSMLWDVEGIDRMVYASLKCSYDRLDSEDAKSCFLLCCLFPEDARIPIDDLVRYYMAGRTFHRDRKPDSLERALDRVHTMVSTLISCCLLLDENYDKDVVKMDDVMRDVAISIAKSEKSFLVKHGVSHWPEKATYDHWSVISLKPNDMLEFPDQLACPELHTLRLDCTDNESWLQVPDRFFSGTENLIVLDLKSVTMSPILPASLAKLAKLQMLCLEGCKLGDIAILKDLKDHLEILSLRRSDIKVLPPEVGELTRLRLLDMDGCNELEVIPKGVISKLFHLEELYMPRTFRQWEGTRADGTGRDISCVSLDELMSLTQLTTLYVCIRDPALLPKDFTFENLVRFDILVGEKGYSYSKDSTGVLLLENIHFANNLEGLLGKPKKSWQRNGLYPSKSFSHLTDLSVTDCSWKYLFSPSLARGLVGLKRLEIERCMDMEGVIGNEGEEDHEDINPIIFSQLDYLRLDNLPNLKSFYPKKEKKATSNESCSAHDVQTVLFTDKVSLPNLKVLHVSDLENLESLGHGPLSAGSLSRLKEFSVRCCGKLLCVFPSQFLPMLEELQELTVESCHSLNVVFQLEGLVPSNILPNLQKLCVEGCPEIESMVFNLKETAADDSTLIIPRLRYLRISDMEKLKSFYSSSTASNAHSLFNHQVAFPKLENLELEGCASLRYTFHPYMGVVNLREIIIKHCSEMRAVINKEIDKEEEVEDRQQRKTETTTFPNLSKLELHHLQELKLFCYYTRPLEFPLLRQMAICYCPSMDSFSLGHVRALDLSLKGITHKMGKMVKDGDDTTMTAQKNQEDVEPKNGRKKILEGSP